jgi:hypothetical protein
MEEIVLVLCKHDLRLGMMLYELLAPSLRRVTKITVDSV